MDSKELIKERNKKIRELRGVISVEEIARAMGLAVGTIKFIQGGYQSTKSYSNSEEQIKIVKTTKDKIIYPCGLSSKELEFWRGQCRGQGCYHPRFGTCEAFHKWEMANMDINIDIVEVVPAKTHAHGGGWATKAK